MTLMLISLLPRLSARRERTFSSQASSQTMVPIPYSMTSTISRRRSLRLSLIGSLTHIM